MSVELYTFHDQTARTYYTYEDVGQYEYDPNLGKGIEAIMLVKWTNQRDHDNNLRILNNGGWDVAQGNALAPSPRARHRYFGGLIVRTLLDYDEISTNTASVVPALQPTGIDMRKDGLTAYACGNQLILSPDDNIQNNITRIINSSMFARLHSVAFSSDGNRILTASSSLDMIYEIDVESGEVEWSMDLWDETPYNTNTLGQAFYRRQASETRDFLVNPSSFELKDDERLRGASCVVDNPSVYKGLGLATALTPVFINAVDYDSPETLLATSFSRGEAWRIDRAVRQVKVVAKALGRPHGLHRDTKGYLVTDTLGEKVIFLSEDFKRESVLDLSRLKERKEGLERAKWLQYTSKLVDNVYCAVMTSRQRLVLFDRANKTRRDILIDPDWGVQMAHPLPVKRSLDFDKVPLFPV